MEFQQYNAHFDAKLSIAIIFTIEKVVYNRIVVGFVFFLSYFYLENSMHHFLARAE